MQSEGPQRARTKLSLHRRNFDLRDEGEDAQLINKAHQQQLNELSHELLVQFHTLLRMLNFHARENEATQKVLLKFHDAIKQLFSTEYELRIEYTGNDFIINDRWIKLSRQLQDLSGKLGEELRHREIGGFWISAVPRPQELLQFVKLLLAIEPKVTDKPFSQLQHQLWHHQIEWISLEKYVEMINWDGGGIDLRAYIRQIYFFALQSVQQIYLQAQQGKPLKLKAIKRAVQAFVELFTAKHRQEEAEFLQMLTCVKNCIDYRYNRAVNTAIHAIGLAASLGFPRNTLRDIGIAGLCYDIGMIKIPAGLEHKANPTPQEKRAVEAHPALAVPLLLNTNYIDSSVMRAVNVAFAHHLGFQKGGFPAYGQSAQSPIAQLISMIDQYDLMTTPHPSRKQIMSPPQALAELTLHSHPTLIRKFIEYMGPLPLATLVELNHQEIGYVLKPPAPGASPRRPFVKILISQRHNQGRIVDLTQFHADGKRPWSLTKILDLGETTPQRALLEDLLT